MRTVVAPDGREWKVGRQWLPYRVRLRREPELPDPSWIELGDMGGAGGLVVGLAIVVVVFLSLSVVWPVLALAVELLILVVVFLVALAGRVAFRRPWRVVARTRGESHATLGWDVVGWRESERVIDEVADGLAAGQLRPRPADAEPRLVGHWNS